MPPFGTIGTKVHCVSRVHYVPTDMVDASLPVSHRDIIDRAGGPAATSRAISPLETEAGRQPVDPNQAKRWRFLNSIPSPYFQSFAQAGLATLEELADAAAMKRNQSANA